MFDKTTCLQEKLENLLHTYTHIEKEDDSKVVGGKGQLIWGNITACPHTTTQLWNHQADKFEVFVISESESVYLEDKAYRRQGRQTSQAGIRTRMQSEKSF